MPFSLSKTKDDKGRIHWTFFGASEQGPASSRRGYHDTHDTMENIDLDYGAAVSAVAIETIARLAVSY